ncbi:MAG TPA: DNA topoisomerase 4 subunit A, partial [Archaeoglobus profundus]|nr:DNA topoisomerase 4 subunit A [Archaeoglobus profundus]
MELVRDISEELKSSYIDYAMSVIVGRALPDVRDGLKPVQRRILWTMFEMGLRHDRPYRKCARIVGETLGKYHPHGDQPVYEALVRMAQDFVMRYPLVDGQGNFGSIDGDEPAAMRYTEARLTKIAEELLADINKNTVDFVPNFDSTLKEPAVLPAKVPNLLINGSTGIAVGMATNIPPHNLKEVCMAIIAYIKNPNITVKELMKYIKGPDFPTGGIIIGKKGIEKAYETGKGRITIRGKVEIEKNAIIIRELPYMVNKARLVEKIADLIKEGKIEARTVRDESDREGIRVVIELKSGADVNAVLEKLYDHTPLQTTFSIINLALVDGEPKILNLKEMITCYVEHRREVIRRRIKYELDKAKERLHIVEGLKIAVENLDEVISIIKASKSPENAKKILIEKYKLSEKQAGAILQMRLQKLTSTEVSSLIKEYNELKAKIAEFEEILKNPAKVDEIIIKELEDLINNYSDRRRTKIIDEEEKEKEIEIIEENVVMITNGFIRRVELDKIRKGKVDIAVKCNNLQKLLVFTNRKAYWL